MTEKRLRYPTDHIVVDHDGRILSVGWHAHLEKFVLHDSTRMPGAISSYANFMDAFDEVVRIVKEKS